MCFVTDFDRLKSFCNLAYNYVKSQDRVPSRCNESPPQERSSSGGWLQHPAEETWKAPKKTSPVIDTSELRGVVGLPEDVATAWTFTLPPFWDFGLHHLCKSRLGSRSSEGNPNLSRDHQHALQNLLLFWTRGVFYQLQHPSIKAANFTELCLGWPKRWAVSAGQVCHGYLAIGGYRGRLQALGTIATMDCVRAGHRTEQGDAVGIIRVSETGRDISQKLNKAFLVKANAPRMTFQGMMIKRETKTTHDFGLNLAV